MGDKFTEEELEKHIADTYAIVSIFGHKLTQQIIEKAVNLKLIANFGVGYDNIDIPYVTSKGIVVTNTPDPVTEPTAELAMGLMVALSRQIGYLNNQLRKTEGSCNRSNEKFKYYTDRKNIGYYWYGRHWSSPCAKS